MWGSPEQQTGEIGAIAVTANFLEIGWGPVIHNRPHDVGTDLFVQAFGPGLFNHGLFVGVQAKGGSSYFKDPAYDEDGLNRPGFLGGLVSGLPAGRPVPA